MKFHRLPIYLVCFCLQFLSLACGTTPNGGVEVGNPKLGGEVVTINPQGQEESYIVRFAEDGSAEVSKVVDGNFEIVPGTVLTEGDIVQVTATFNQGPSFEAEIQVDENGEIIAVSLILDGVVVPTETTIEFDPPSPQATWSNDALLAVATICRRVSECQASTLVSECEAELVEMPGLAQSFGSAPGQSLKETGEELENGERSSDPAALEQCLREIATLPCAQVDRGHDPRDPHNYSQARKLVPKPSCAHAFSGHP